MVRVQFEGFADGCGGVERQCASHAAASVRRARMEAESTRMVTEKVAASAEAQTVATVAAMKGGQPHAVAGKALKVFKKRVRANNRRLTRR